MDAALPNPVVELGEDHVGAVDLVAGGGEVLADRAQFGAAVDGVFQQPGGSRPVGVGAGERYAEAFGGIWDACLDEGASRDLIHHAAEEL